MTKLKKQIVEEAKKILFKANKLPPEANYFGSVDHIKYSASEILKLSEEFEHSSRWRKVSEELPEEHELAVLRLSVPIRDMLPMVDIVVGYREGSVFLDANVNTLFDVIEWKPID